MCDGRRKWEARIPLQCRRLFGAGVGGNDVRDVCVRVARHADSDDGWDETSGGGGGRQERGMGAKMKLWYVLLGLGGRGVMSTL